jgi:hypothetical protein
MTSLNLHHELTTWLCSGVVSAGDRNAGTDIDLAGDRPQASGTSYEEVRMGSAQFCDGSQGGERTLTALCCGRAGDEVGGAAGACPANHFDELTLTRRFLWIFVARFTDSDSLVRKID